MLSERANSIAQKNISYSWTAVKGASGDNLKSEERRSPVAPNQRNDNGPREKASRSHSHGVAHKLFRRVTGLRMTVNLKFLLFFDTSNFGLNLLR